MTVRVGLMVIISLFAAFMLSILPLPAKLVWWRPEWVLLIVLFWILVSPQYFGIGFAWGLGLLTDSLQGTLLGEHAFAMVICAYLLLKFDRPIANLPLWQQSLVICLLVLLYRLILLLIHGMLGDIDQQPLFWLPAITSMLVWPWIYLLFRDATRSLVMGMS